MTAFRWTRRAGLVAVALMPAALAGCSRGEPAAGPAPAEHRHEPHPPAPDDEVKAERDKLTAEDRAAVDAQEWCAVTTAERLGSMGPPLKVQVQDQTVFVCCKGCVRKAQADPDKTLATVADLKAKAKAGRPQP